ERHRYDALLDQHEPDVRTETVSAAFDELKRELLPVLEAIKDRPPVDDSFLYREYDAKKLLDFGLELARAIGYDMGRGAVAYSPHPFPSAIAAGDVRITTWNNPDLKGPLMATVH